MTRPSDIEEDPIDRRPPWGDAFATPGRAPALGLPDSDTPGREPEPTALGSDVPANGTVPEVTSAAAASPGTITSRAGDVEQGDSGGAEPGDPTDRAPDRRQLLLIAGTVLLLLSVAVTWFVASRAIPTDVADASYAGSLGIINDRAVVEDRAVDVSRSRPAETVAQAPVARAVAACVAAADPPLEGALRMAAEVRMNGTDALVLVAGDNGPSDVRIVDASTCAPLDPSR